MDPNKNFDIVIQPNNTFYFTDTTKQNNSDSSIEMLEKIKKIVKHDMNYSSTTEDAFSKLPKVELLKVLKSKSSEICDQYLGSLSKLNRFSRKTLSIKVNGIQNKINHYISLLTKTNPALPPLSNELTQEVIKYLGITDLVNFAKVNRNARVNAYQTFPKIARKYGYKGHNVIEARNYLMELLEEARILYRSFHFPLKSIRRTFFLGAFKAGKSVDKLKKLDLLEDFVNFFSKKEIYEMLIPKIKETLLLNFADKEYLIPRPENEVGMPEPQTWLPRSIRLQATKALILAAENGEKKVVELLLKFGVDPNALGYNCTPLHFAAQNGHTEIVEMLLVNGAKVDAATPLGNTALVLACVDFPRFPQESNAKVIELLLKAGANANAISSAGSPVLHYAANHGHADVVKLLIDKGADVNSQVNNNAMALHYACGYGDQTKHVPNAEVVKLLLKHGANPNIRDPDGLTPLQSAIKYNYTDIIKLLPPPPVQA